MGTWGEGNFSNDGALDYLAHVLGHLRETVNELLASPAGDIEDRGEAELMPSVEILAVLCEHLNAAPPEPAEIESWRERYLARFDAQIDALSPRGDFKARRRATIEATFARLAKRANEFHRR
jgi:hypothetical protein